MVKELGAIILGSSLALSSVGQVLRDDFRVNDDVGVSGQRESAIAMNGTGDFVIVWRDERSDTGDIYCQRYDSSGEPQGTNFRVNDDTGKVLQHSPSVTMSDSCFIVSWTDYRDYSEDTSGIQDTSSIYVQRYDNCGNELGSNLKVSDIAYYYAFPHYSSHVAMNGDGKFVVVWGLDSNQSGSAVYGQGYSEAGVPQGDNFIVDRGGSWAGVFGHSVVWGDHCNSMVAWCYEMRWSSSTQSQFIGVAQFDSLGVRVGETLNVRRGMDLCFSSASVARNDSAEFVVGWGENGQAFTRVYQGWETPRCSRFRVDNSEIEWTCGSVSAAMDNSSRFIIVWNDKRYGNPNVFIQKYLRDSLPCGKEIRINNEDTCSHIAGKQSVALNDSVCAFTWMDDRNGNWDTYAKLLDWRSLGTEEAAYNPQPSAHGLSAHPNPFTQFTVISYWLPVVGRLSEEQITRYTSHMTLAVYNLSGQLIRTFDLTNHRAPFNRITWDRRDEQGNESVTGIYFVRLAVKEEIADTRKLVLVR